MVLHVGGHPVEFAELAWTTRDAKKLGTSIGAPDGQTSWEYLVILVALVLWGHEHRETGVAILGDNLAALNGALHLRGRGALTLITKELSWRKVRLSWKFAAGHLPSEHNHLADALSRLHAPQGSERKSFPGELVNARRRDAPVVSELWYC